jgi:thiol-disulfide isomerase/thioredoxin
MKSSLPIIIGVVALVVGIGYFATQDKGAKQDSVANTNVETRAQDSALPPVNETEIVSPEATATEVASAGTYLPYSADAVVTSDADHILLSFSATWCPSCRALDADIVKNAGTIPDGVAIFKVDYDTSAELKRKYGVTTQHSIIEINKSGDALSTISHPPTLNALIATIK